jgi:hypothetical protein
MAYLQGWTPCVLPNDIDLIEGSGDTRHSVDAGNSDQLAWLVPWASRFYVAESMSGSQHPSLTGCYCGDIEIRTLMDDLPPSVQISAINELPTYTQNNGYVGVLIARYSTDFSTAPWPCDVTKPAIEAGTQLKFEHRSAGQFLHMRPEDMRHQDNEAGAATGRKWRHDSQAGRKLIGLGEFHLTWLYVEEPPIDNWRDALKGRVNSVTFLDSPAECLLFADFDVRPATRFSLLDPFCFEVVVQFRERRIKVGSNTYGWNHEYEPAGWKRVKMDDGSGNVGDRYEKADFTNMFTYSACSSSSSSGA